MGRNDAQQKEEHTVPFLENDTSSKTKSDQQNKQSAIACFVFEPPIPQKCSSHWKSFPPEQQLDIFWQKLDTKMIPNRTSSLKNVKVIEHTVKYH